jgi:hypothetical protein
VRADDFAVLLLIGFIALVIGVAVYILQGGRRVKQWMRRR